MDNANQCSGLGSTRFRDAPEKRRILQPIETAHQRRDQEQAEIEAEERAFDQFAERVRAIECGSPAVSASVRRRRLGADGASNQLAQVRTAYRETVMDVVHYDREYDEPLPAHLSAELGMDLASGICDGSDSIYTPPFKRTLLGAIQQSRHERTSFRSILDNEGDSLDTAKRRLTDAVTQLTDGVRDAHSVGADPMGDANEDLLDTIVCDRQHHLQTSFQLHGITTHDLCEYLYDEEEWTYPVLTATASLYDAVAHL